MALSLEQLNAKYGKPGGEIDGTQATPENIALEMARIRNIKSGAPAPGSNNKSFFQDLAGDVKQTWQSMLGRFSTGADKIGEIDKIDQSSLSSGFQKFGTGVGVASAVIGDLFVGGIKAFASPEDEKKLKSMVENTAVNVMSTPWVSSSIKSSIEAYQKLKQTNPEIAGNLEGLYNVAMLAADVAGLSFGKKVIERGGKAVVNASTDAIGGVAMSVDNVAGAVSDVGRKATPFVDSMLQKAERIPGRVSTNLKAKQATEQAIQELPTTMAKKAVRDGVDINDVKSILEIPQTKNNAFKDLFESVKNYATTKTGARPEEVVGKPIVEAMKKADELRKKVGSQLGDVAKNLGVVTKKELVDPVFNKLKSVSGLDGLKLKNGILDFSDTTLASNLTKSDRRAIQEAFTNATRWGNGERLHRFRQELFEILGGKKKSLANITDTQEKAYQAIREGLSNVLETKNPAYKKLSQQYRDIVAPLSDMRKFFKNIPDASEDILEMNAGLLARRLTSNAQSGVQVKEILRSLDQALKGSYGVSTEKLQDFYNLLSRYYDISSPTGFKGQIEGAIKNSDTIFGKATEVLSEVTGVTPEVRQQAIENLFKDISKGSSNKNTQELYGLAFGIEPEQDENGNITGVGFNPAMAAGGLAGSISISKLAKLKSKDIDVMERTIDYARLPGKKNNLELEAQAAEVMEKFGFRKKMPKTLSGVANLFDEVIQRWSKLGE